MRFASLTHHLVLWFVVVALLPLLLFGYLSLRQNEAALRAEAQTRMSRLADKKAMEIKAYLVERTLDAQLLARGLLAEQAMSVLSRAYAQHGPASAEYREADRQFRGSFSAYIDESAMFYDVFLITPQGEIVYSDKHEADFATNLLDGPYRDSQLAEAFRESRLIFESSFSGFGNYAPSGAPAAFVAVPLIRDGIFLGVIAFQLNTGNIYRVALEASGLGVTGETVLAESVGIGEAMFVAPLRRDPQAAMRGRMDLTRTAIPMRHALAGRHGDGMETDYSGRQVVAAWRYLPELRWGMVVKMDADEVFEPVYRQRRVLLEILLALVLFAGAAAFYFGRRLVVPLQAFAATADQVARGELGKRVAESGLGEIGALGGAFNRMTGNLELLYRTLEERVEERTRELHAANEQLQGEIVERERVEAQLVKSIASLEAINKALDEFTYIAAHDLKEPLRGIHNYTSFLKEDYGERLGGDAQQYINSIQRLAERLSALIDRLLAYSRLGSTELASNPVDVDALVDAVAEDLGRLWMDAAHGGMGVELRRKGPLGAAQGDATRIGEVFQNLISNAAKYNDKPSKWIEVGCERSGPVPVYYVRDNGIGIQPHHRDSVFRIFKRLHEQNKYGGGTGAGLTITKKIVELHGGRIWLDSTPGEGTTFYFTLSGEA